MTDDHKAPPIAGYQDISADKLKAVNAIKEVEEAALRMIDALQASDETDKRWVAIARTQIQQGYMAAVRSVMQPGRIKLPGDDRVVTDPSQRGQRPEPDAR